MAWRGLGRLGESEEEMGKEGRKEELGGGEPKDEKLRNGGLFIDRNVPPTAQRRW